MFYNIHFICRDKKNVEVVEHPIYTTGHWGVMNGEADKLVGGMIYLHEKKNDPSYFGGRVLSWDITTEIVSPEHAGDIIFTIEATADGKGKKWSGQNHSMAWTSGLIED